MACGLRLGCNSQCIIVTARVSGIEQDRKGWDRTEAQCMSVTWWWQQWRSLHYFCGSSEGEHCLHSGSEGSAGCGEEKKVTHMVLAVVGVHAAVGDMWQGGSMYHRSPKELVCLCGMQLAKCDTLGLVLEERKKKQTPTLKC